jgi:uncharacterized repeat protein (TIGR03803 family)
MRSKKSSSTGKTTFTIFITLLLASAIVPTPAQARKFKVLHTFHKSDGFGPVGALTRDAKGNLYGTTSGGGRGVCGGFTCGTAFKLDGTGKQIWLHSFNGKSGMGPEVGLLRDGAGNLYGTTIEGGDLACAENSLGCGTVFKLDKTGRETVLYKFRGDQDGWAADSPVVMDSAGNLYGTTERGGTSTWGTIFQVDKNGKETVLYSFMGGSDGCLPIGVIMDAAGNLYGVASQGGSESCSFGGDGVVFKLDTTGSFSVLHTFRGSDGAIPASVLLLDSARNLYGTTAQGGSSMTCFNGCGTVFKVTSDGVETVLYSFCSLQNCIDGERPVDGPLLRDSKGNLYGTTVFGGAYHNNCNRDSCGVVFKLSTTGTETVLHSFSGGTDGAIPEAGLITDGLGSFYGAAMQGGDANCTFNGEPGCGVVFKIGP